MFADYLERFNELFDEYKDTLREYNNAIESMKKEDEEQGRKCFDADAVLFERLSKLSEIGILEENKVFSSEKELRSVYEERKRYFNKSYYLFILNSESKFYYIHPDHNYDFEILKKKYSTINRFKEPEEWYRGTVNTYIDSVQEGLKILEKFKIDYNSLATQIEKIELCANELISSLKKMENSYGSSFKRLLYKLGFKSIYTNVENAYNKLVSLIDPFLSSCIKCISIDYENDKKRSEQLRKDYDERRANIDKRYVETIRELEEELKQYDVIYPAIQKLEDSFGKFNSSNEYMDILANNLYVNFKDEEYFLNACRDSIDKKNKLDEDEAEKRRQEEYQRAENERRKAEEVANRVMERNARWEKEKQLKQQRDAASQLCHSCKHYMGCMLKFNLSSPVCLKFENKH